jgi:hypothetical protein
MTAGIIALLVIASAAGAERLRFDSLQRGQHEYAILIGYGENHRIPDETRDHFSFDVLRFRLGWLTSHTTELGATLSFEKPCSGADNSAMSAAGSYRRRFLVRGSTALAYDFTFGITQLANRLSSLGSTTNFTTQLGLAFQHGVGPRSAISLEYKFSHTSNGGIKLPNLGINASILSIGYSWYR